MNSDNRLKRLDWNQYFMHIARQVATRATCDRKHVGAVIVRNKTIVATGYNGSVRGMPHCDEMGHMIEGGHCVATIHAEANAIISAARNGVSVLECNLYTTASPCWSCFKMIANSGISRIFYSEFYREHRSLEVAKQLGIELIHLPIPDVGDDQRQEEQKQEPESPNTPPVDSV